MRSDADQIEGAAAAARRAHLAAHRNVIEAAQGFVNGERTEISLHEAVDALNKLEQPAAPVTPDKDLPQPTRRWVRNRHTGAPWW